MFPEQAERTEISTTFPRTDQMVRLMHNGTGHVGSASIRRVCVKAEWDKAEAWLENEEEEGRLPR